MSDDRPDDPDALWRDSARQYHEERCRSESVASSNQSTTLDGDAEIKRLACMSLLEYCRLRKTVAKRLQICLGDLDKLVRGYRKSSTVDHDDPQHWAVEPAATSVDGAKLLDLIKSIFEKYLVLPPHAGEGIALWTLHTWTIDASDISPYLALISPERRCGKTTVLKLLNRLTRRAALSSSITPAALFRYVAAKCPTLLIDEFDATRKENEEMRGILNSGHSREGAYSIRCDGQDNQPKRFSTWAPKAIASINKIADTLMDRSIVIPMRRKKKAEHRQRYRDFDYEEFKRLRSQALRWANDSIEVLLDAEPDIPKALNDRAADNWRPLLAIADRVGGPWPKSARAAALALSGDDATDDTEGVQLLADIEATFTDRGVDRLASADLIAVLIAIEGRPWGEWRGGKPLSAHGLARLLKPFRVMPTTIRIGECTAKGYQLSDFQESFEVYLGQDGAVDPSQRNKADEPGASDPSEKVTPEVPLRFEKRRKPTANGHCDDVTVASPGKATASHVCAHCDRPGATGRCFTADILDGVWLHRGCERSWLAAQSMPPIPDFLRRDPLQ